MASILMLSKPSLEKVQLLYTNKQEQKPALQANSAIGPHAKASTT